MDRSFSRARSTVLQLLTVLDRWTEILDRGRSVDAAYCEFMKAFDKISHQKLIHKLSLYNIGQTYTRWIEAFLIDRKQRVLVNGVSSKWKCVSSGIVQGSVTGQIFFVLYINNSPSSKSSESDIFLFADDAKIFKKVHYVEDCEQLQSDTYLMNDVSENGY